ncbi:TIGR04283 family arsenosugar biosynthesis glycosyltransferase [Synechococcus sp. 8F6]|uniref:TIGR04283 family arsenosugar biosynthesis glycosyltransferase n=1 Tax=Synechococcus sp. 8F6 TaxID=2025606 RepID=UPI0035104E32
MALSGSPIAVVIAARNEAPRLPLLLADLAAAPQLVGEILVVDGASDDATARVAALAGAAVQASSPGRGRQLALGVASTESPWLLLLHADARFEPGWDRAVRVALGLPDAAWYFDLAIAAAQPALRLVELAVALRSRWRQLPYGDQGLLVPRRLLARAGGVALIPLMEDLELVLRLRHFSQLRPLGARLQVDGRRWQALGVWQTALANAQLRRSWRRGIPPEALAARYYGSAVRERRRG